MAIKVEQLTQTQPVEAPHAADRSDGSFKFTLASHIEESELQEKLSGMMNDITEQGEKLAEHMENFLDRRGRHRVYGIVKLVDKNLDDLASELVKDEKDHLTILSKVGEIRGLLLDVCT